MDGSLNSELEVLGFRPGDVPSSLLSAVLPQASHLTSLNILLSRVVISHPDQYVGLQR